MNEEPDEALTPAVGTREHRQDFVPRRPTRSMMQRSAVSSKAAEGLQHLLEASTTDSEVSIFHAPASSTHKLARQKQAAMHEQLVELLNLPAGIADDLSMVVSVPKLPQVLHAVANCLYHTDAETCAIHQHRGRLGSSWPMLHLSNLSPDIMQGEDATINERTGFVVCKQHFPTITCDTAVATGQWMFEVTILTAGVIQIGWALPGSEYTVTTGVGDNREHVLAGKARGQDDAVDKISALRAACDVAVVQSWMQLVAKHASAAASLVPRLLATSDVHGLWRHLVRDLCVNSQHRLLEVVLRELSLQCPAFLDWEENKLQYLHVVLALFELEPEVTRAWLLRDEHAPFFFICKLSTGIEYEDVLGEPWDPTSSVAASELYQARIEALHVRINQAHELRTTLLTKVIEQASTNALLRPMLTQWLGQLQRGRHPASVGVLMALAGYLENNGLAKPAQWVEANLPDGIFVNHDPSGIPVTRVGGRPGSILTDLNQEVAEGQRASLPDGVAPSFAAELWEHMVRLFSTAMPVLLRPFKTLNVEVTIAIETVQAAARLAAEHPDSQMQQNALQKQISHCRKTVGRAVVGSLALLGNWRRSRLQRVLHGLGVVISRVCAKKLHRLLPLYYVEALMELLTGLHSEPVLLTDADAFVPYMIRNNQIDALLHGARALFELTVAGAVPQPDLHTMLVNHVRHLMGQPRYVDAFGTDKATQTTLLRAVMSHFEGNSWVSSTEILQRIFGHDTFAYDVCQQMVTLPSHETPFDTTSPALQHTLGEVLRGEVSMVETEFTAKFLNHFLNQANWTLAEFYQMAEDLRTQADPQAHNREQQQQDGKFRRCVLLYELLMALLRTMEGMCRVCPSICTASTPSARTTQIRVLEIALHILDRALNTHHHEFLTSKLLTNTCIREPLVCAVTGALMSLAEASPDTVTATAQSPQLSPELMTQLEQFYTEFAERLDAGSGERLATYLSALRRKHLQHCQEQQRIQRERQESGLLSSDDDDEDLCPICYATPQEVTFEPCGHRSCEMCIQRHLLNSTKCFFCNEPVKSARAMLEQDYGERTWNELLDRQDLPGRVQLSLVPVEQIAGRRIPELLPPAALPMGNVGTPVSLIKQAIRESRMPPSLLRQLRLDFTRTKARKFGSVPPPVGRGLTTSRTAAAPPPVPASTSATASAPPGAAPVVVNPGQTARSHLKKQLRVLAGLAQSQKRDIDGVHDEHLAAATQQTLREANRFDGPDVTDRHMEEWDRHMAIHPETARERDKERLFEQDVSNPWDKAGADALVWHNDAYYWDKMKGDFEEETADDYEYVLMMFCRCGQE
ncbi:uncharacterized protein MONBRDRAFT_29379 [Monosiga brevicollis MX1]|uniref:RING-type E3 ubiquitin transferase n=1 Tax=Monosiga brevicollis TaxID=81824 RepID=A9VAX3_MONBE|nr:uncharacterized protein MONBRDRAFT_29379 [Monosiga brevicollis MX1]EDQ85240.1 predicted protein [Monosiga brevicollis MX1]|eukprot:XP_001749861.1 hypothetical protein [Monosiga brevicollis MX1]